LIDLIWPDAASAADPHEALASVLTRSVYLQQDVIRQFVEASSDHERFLSVSELVGAGRVEELQSALEREKKAWTTATNQRREELRPSRERLDQIEARLSELTSHASQASAPITPEEWREWWQNLSALPLKAAPTEPASRDAPAAIDRAIKELDALRRSTERRLQALSATRTESAGLASRPMPEILPLREKVTTLRNKLDGLKLVIAEEQTRLAEFRRHQAELKEKNEQLKALASLALQNLGEHCPVCTQEYDRESTQLRLQAIVRGTTGDSHEMLPAQELDEHFATVAVTEEESGAADLALRSAEREVNERQKAQETIDNRLREFGLVVSDAAAREAAVARAIAEAEGLIRRVAELQRVGESLALRIAQSSAIAAMDELRREAEKLRTVTADLVKDVAARDKTGELAQRVIEALREAASAVVEERLQEVAPLLQSIWARIDPHPSFRVVTFFPQVFKGKGRLATVLSDPVEGKESNLPGAVLSSSQVNALAVSVFLALNIGVPRPPLSVAMLDDPLQSLDDINLLGLVDLFRRVKDQRQLFVSTHDKRFGDLISRKLRPADEKHRTVVIELDDWTRQGPTIGMREVKPDPVPLRLVS
jgi:DNA repair exonuclease SbcCD ATPase subunit